MIYDYMIIGHGVAGSVLCETLEQRGNSVLVIDHSTKNSSSKLAAGLFNPITGQNYVKTWEADMLFPCLHRFYSAFEKKLQIKFFYPKIIYRPFDTIERQNFWIAKSSEKAYEAYVKDRSDDHLYEDTVNAPHGGIEILQGGFVDLKPMLQAHKEYLKEKSCFIEAKIKDEDLKFEDDCVSYEGFKAKKIILCTGAYSPESTFFKWLPFRRTKGEILEVGIEGAGFSNIVNKGCWLIPQKEGGYKCGSTYEWQDLTDTPTEKAKNQILEKLKPLVKNDFSINKHYAGVRPTTRDRKPFVGIHPQNKLLGIFNGLGTKGVSQAPYLAEMFADFLAGKGNLSGEADILRYKKLMK